MPQPGKVLTFASTKGGVGKTTAAAALAGELALDGHRVGVLDGDPNGHLGRWARLAALPTLSACEDVAEETVMAHIREQKAAQDFVVVDLPGFGANILTYAIARSDLVVIPAQASAMDLNDALKTDELVRRTEEVADRAIPRVVLLTKTAPGIRPRVLDHARRQLEARGIPVLRAEFMERAVFREMTFTGKVPRLVEGQDNAAANVRAIAGEIVARLAGAVPAAAP